MTNPTGFLSTGHNLSRNSETMATFAWFDVFERFPDVDYGVDGCQFRTTNRRILVSTR